MHEFARDLVPDAPAAEPARVYILGDASLDLGRGELRRDGVDLHLRPRTFDVLVYLVRHAGRLVTKQEVMDAVWGDVAVTDDSLVQCLVEIRKALGEDSVTTQRGRGYRFERPVRFAAGVSGTDAGSQASAGLAEAPAPVVRVRSRAAWMVAAGLAAVALFVALYRAPATRSARPVVATVGESTNAEARREVLAGQEMRQRPSRTRMAAALAHFERAVALDPGYAAAHVGLSRTLTAASVFGAVRPADVGARAKGAALRAIELDPTLADAYTALAHSQVQHEWDWAGAEASYLKAIALDPTNVSAHNLYGMLLGALGRFEEALGQNGLAPVQPGRQDMRPRRSLRGILLYLARRPEAATDEQRAAIALEPDVSLSHFWLALAYAETGRLDDAMQSALVSRNAMGNQPAWVVGYVHARAGRRAEAATVLRALEAQAEQAYVPATDFAFLHVGLGDREAALASLEKGLDERSHWMELLAVHPVVDPLRGEPRFQHLLQTLSLPTRLASEPR